MAKGLIGRKLGMTQVFDEKGNVVPVTVLEAGPCVVTDLRTEEQHGYKAVQLGFGEVKEKALSKAEVGHVKKNGIAPHRTLMEFRDADLEVEVGASVAADLFSAGDRVKVTSVSKGKGFQGVMKRHGFGGGRMTHGSHFHRAPGSIGASSDPSRVFKGKKMPGHAGQLKTTVSNLKIMQVDLENNRILVKGAVPGARTSVVRIEVMG
ncbi:MAG: 50S ribosomal protein L3 [Spirochaetaceae bacterium]|nr:50S ribosomal protein L3 [Spirochaetaceae bacterium]|tara:strand:+ start:69659 stop:70279 length:621 start_codon:yes stop_codon:yes gene_type:complete